MIVISVPCPFGAARAESARRRRGDDRDYFAVRGGTLSDNVTTGGQS